MVPSATKAQAHHQLMHAAAPCRWSISSIINIIIAIIIIIVILRLFSPSPFCWKFQFFRHQDYENCLKRVDLCNKVLCMNFRYLGLLTVVWISAFDYCPSWAISDKFEFSPSWEISLLILHQVLDFSIFELSYTNILFLLRCHILVYRCQLYLPEDSWDVPEVTTSAVRISFELFSKCFEVIHILER